MVKRNFSLQDRMKQNIEGNSKYCFENAWDRLWPKELSCSYYVLCKQFLFMLRFKVQRMTSVNTNCSFRHFWGFLQLFLLKGFEMAFGGTALIRQFFSWFAYFMSSGDICEHRFCKKLELLYIKITCETLLRMTVLLTMKCLKQTLAHPLYWISCMPIEGKIILVTLYVDMFLFIFNMHVIPLHCCVVLLNFKTAIC